MCGFAGFVRPGGFERDQALSLGHRMGEAIRRRGPDDSGVWCDERAGVLLSHRRLAIIDITAAGHQPMLSPSGRYIIAFNGEIYNHLDLREILSAPSAGWRGHSDTETLLAGFDAWGIDEAVGRSVGMFAFAVWDRQLRRLVLGRDRLGEKPLYYGVQDDQGTPVLLFGSQLDALAAHPAFRAPVDRDALCLFMRHGYLPAPYTIYRGLRKLQPGRLLEWSMIAGADALRGVPSERTYWSVRDAAARGKSAPFAGSEDDAVAELDALLRDAVGRQMVADVPLGAFLSGGIDSSTIVSLMQSQSSRKVKTFTIGFNEKAYDEAVHAAAVARHLGTDHTELYVTAREAQDVIPQLPTFFDEPFADSSQIPTYLVSRLAREHVTVSLSGDAGDELFGGYSRYAQTARIWDALGSVPGPLRAGVGAMLRAVPVSGWNVLGTVVRGALPPRLRNVGDKAHKLAHLLRHDDCLALYRDLVSNWQDPAGVVIGATEPPYLPQCASESTLPGDFVERVMLLDSESYLPEDILVKVDRAAMSVSLETRVPMLDHRVVEFAWRLPLAMKYREGRGKLVLRRVLDRYVPRPLIDRPKTGFGIPLSDWLRGPLRDWAESLLDESRLRREGFLHAALVRERWRQHLTGRSDWQASLWCVLMFQSWLERSKSHAAARVAIDEPLDSHA